MTGKPACHFSALEAEPLKAAILILGSEILSGAGADLNAPFLSRALGGIGIETVKHIAVADDLSQILGELHSVFFYADLAVLTGGLGPTFDDVTRRALSEFTGRPLVFSRREYERVRKRYLKQKRVLGGLKSEMYFPAGSIVLRNRFGIAPGFAVPFEGKWIIALPGVPAEAHGIFREEGLPFLKKIIPSRRPQVTVTAKILDLPEMTIVKKLGKGFPPRDPAISCGIYPRGGEVDLRLRISAPSHGRVKKEAARWKKFLKRKLGNRLAGFSEEPLEKILVDLLLRRGETVSSCESVTGGMIAKRFTDVPGSSRVFEGSVVAYSDRIKKEAAGVSPRILRRWGAVSRQTAGAMAEAVRVRFSTDWCVATTGLAGPRGDSSAKSVGTVFVAVSGSRRTRVKEFRFVGTREKVRSRASQAALMMFWSLIAHGKC